MKPCKISAHSDKHLDDIFVIMSNKELSKLAEIVLRFIESKKCWKFQLSILTNKKVLFLKKIWSVPCTIDSSYFSQKMATWRPNFPYPRLWVISYSFSGILKKTLQFYFHPQTLLIVVSIVIRPWKSISFWLLGRANEAKLGSSKIQNT